VYPHFGKLTFITPYGLMLVIALLACWFYARSRAPKFGVDASHIDLAVPLIFTASVLGSQILAGFSPGAAGISGGVPINHMRFSLFALLLFAMPALYLYCRLSGLSLGKMLDLFALPALACLMLIRLGCFMAGCCWGDLARPPPQLADVPQPGLVTQVFTLPWLSGANPLTAVSFPAGSFAYRQQLALGLIEPGAIGSLPVHPTQLYEFALLAVLLYLLSRFEDRWIPAGAAMLVALGSYAVLRFFIEFLRADNALVVGLLTFTQLLCAVLFMLCVTLIFTVRRGA